MYEEDQSKNTQGMGLNGLQDLSMEKIGYGSAQAAARAVPESQVLQGTDAPVGPGGVGTGQAGQAAYPAEQFKVKAFQVHHDRMATLRTGS